MEQKKSNNMNLLNKKKFIILKYLKLAIKNGKKETNEKLVKLSFSLIKTVKKKSGLIILLEAIQKATPFCEVKSLKIKGGIQRIPVEMKQKRQKRLVLNWLLVNTFTRIEKTLVERLAKELLETILLQSKTIKMCDDLHKIVEANKTFTQFKL